MSQQIKCKKMQSQARPRLIFMGAEADELHMNFIDRKWLSIALESAFSGMRVGGKRTFNKKVVSGLSIFAALLPKFAQLSSRKIHTKAQKHSFRSYAIGLRDFGLFPAINQSKSVR